MGFGGAGADDAAVPHGGPFGRAAHPFFKCWFRNKFRLPENFGELPEAFGLQHFTILGSEFHAPPTESPARRPGCGRISPRFR